MIVEKVMNKDKNYNRSVAIATSKEIQIDILKQKIEKLLNEQKEMKLLEMETPPSPTKASSASNSALNASNSSINKDKEKDKDKDKDILASELSEAELKLQEEEIALVI